METTNRFEAGTLGVRASGWAKWVLALFASMLLVNGALAAATKQKTFSSPEEAVEALVQAVKAHDRPAVLGMLGDVAAWIGSGDAVADHARGEAFVAAYQAKHLIAREGDTARLTVGSDDYPFAFPIVKQSDRWRFDSAAGKEELLARRIGENELDAMKVLLAIVDAQREYASEDRNGDGIPEYAQKFASSEGKRDGLYWKVKAGEPASPLGELVASADAAGYRRTQQLGTPYRGYYYRLLKGQGRNAASGAFEYVVRGRAIGGFAVIAYPAKYGNSGIMTFMVNQDGQVYQADLGPKTQQKASGITRFDPGKGWTAVSAP